MPRDYAIKQRTRPAVAVHYLAAGLLQKTKEK